MTYLLNTNACIALINGNPSQVRERFQRTMATGDSITVSSVVAFELWYGVAKSTQKVANSKRLEAFFAGPLDLLVFDDEDARTAGTIRAELEVGDNPIGAYDLLISGQALRYGATLVTTANVSEFSRVPGLTWENWASLL